MKSFFLILFFICTIAANAQNQQIRKTFDLQKSDFEQVDPLILTGRSQDSALEERFSQIEIHHRLHPKKVLLVTTKDTIDIHLEEIYTQVLQEGNSKTKKLYIPIENKVLSDNSAQLIIDFIFNPEQEKNTFRSKTNDESSVLSEGDWYKIPMVDEGLYKIDQNWIRENGLGNNRLNWQFVRLFGHDEGVLPQSNATPRPFDLQEIPYHLDDSNDVIYFFVKNHHKIHQHQDGFFEKTTHPYTTSAFIYLQLNAPESRRTLPMQSPPGEASISLDWYQEIWHHERDLNNLLESGRVWYGERVDHGSSLSISLSASGLKTGQDHHITIAGASRSTTPGLLVANVGGNQAIQINYNPISGQRYDFIGTRKVESSPFPSTVSSLNGLQLNFTGSGGNTRHLLLDYVTINFSKTIQTQNQPFVVRNATLNEGDIVSYTSNSNLPNYRVWDVSEYDNYTELPIQRNGSQSNISVSYKKNQSLLFFTLDQAQVCPPARRMNNQNIRQANTADFIIITHPSLLSEAQRLARHRAEHNQIEVLVVTTEQVYNEFSGGKTDITALRDFIRHQYQKGQGKLTNVLLFGKGTYDPKNILQQGNHLVPLYQSRESLHELFSFSSDDYLGFMDDDEGEWFESRMGDHAMDIGIGRIPAKNRREAGDVVNKIIFYDQDPEKLGNWRNKVVFVADDGDNNIHMRDAERLSNLVKTNFPGTLTEKVYLDNFTLETTQRGSAYPEAEIAIKNKIVEGALIVNYNGHGNFDKLADETIIDRTGIASWTNLSRLPFFVTATCEFGRHDMPGIISGGESLILLNRGGAIGLVTTSRPVFSFTNFQLNEAFYGVVLKRNENQALTLGEIQKETKNNSLNGSLNRNFILLGDPSMHIGAPGLKVNLEGITNLGDNSSMDTLKALSQFEIKGNISTWQSETLVETQGKVWISIYDKPSRETTQGNRGQTFTFSQFDNLLTRIEAEVINGQFTAQAMLPKNMDYTPENGKIHFYFQNSATGIEGSGSANIIIGLSENPPLTDTEGPTISMQVINPRTGSGENLSTEGIFIATLEDPSGINVTNERFGQSLRAEINGEEIILNNHFSGRDGGFTKGQVEYNLKNLKTGENKIILKAWDKLNNFSESEITFFAGEITALQIADFNIYPNPFTEKVNFEFKHDRPGDDLEVRLELFDIQGQLIFSETRDYIASWEFINDIQWEVDRETFKNNESSVYILRLNVRSKKDGAKSSTSRRLIRAN